MDVTPIVKDVVLVGGGHSHVEVLRRFGMEPMRGVRVTLVSRVVHTPYSGMLPGLVAGHYGFDETHIDLRPLARFARARFVHDEVVGLDPDARRVVFRERPPLPYDLVSINVGATPDLSVPGAAEHAVPVKPIGRFVAHWERLATRVVGADEPARVGVVGGGAGGVEILLAVRHRLRALVIEAGGDPERVTFALFSDTDELLAGHNRGVRSRFARILDERGVAVHTGAAVTEARADGVIVRGELHPLDELLWVTQAAPAPWIAAAGLDTDDAGFLRVDACLRSTSHPEVFAAGDVAAIEGHPRPKSGVFAVRAGPPLTDNLRRVLVGEAPQPWRPQRRFLSLISTGDRRAVASRGSLAWEGPRIWHWKDWIDRRFMRRYRELPAMDTEGAPEIEPGLAGEDALEALRATAMRCGGCGAKVGADILTRALDGLDVPSPDELVVGLDAPDDAAVLDLGGPELIVQTADAFRAMIDDPYVFGVIAANHALGDVWAMGARPRAALAIATLPYGLEDKVETDLRQLMAGAASLFRRTGTALAGGHTAEGPELALGFAVTGTAAKGALLRKGGLAPGDRLVLTKAIGTGTLLAADMRGAAVGRHVTAAIASMTRPSDDAAHILAAHGVTACTDVTGFGLVGHLVEMLRASGVSAAVDVAAVPLLDGALDCVARGITSSLQPHNLRLRRALSNAEEAARDPAYPLLFDPQTAGGLLAGVPGERAEACVTALRDAGHERAAIVGEVVAGPGQTIAIRGMVRA